MIAIPSPLFPNTGLRRLRVGIVTETYGPEVNGVAMTVGRLVEGLLARGHSVQLIRPRQHPRDDPHRAGPLDVWPVAGAAIPFYRNLRIGFPAGRLLLERWRQAPPDVVHIVTEGPLGHSALAVARRLRLRVFSGFHTNFHAYSRHYGMGLLARSIVAYLRRFHNRTDCTLVPTEELATELRTLGFHRLRVLARGVDTIAHRTALDTGGRTIAVLANGLDTIYPPENRRLAEEITEHGAIVSDYPLGTKPRADFFPRRNRILSGLSLGTLVIEGDVKSGAMITAKFATEQNRDVFAVPGSIFSPQSRGPLSLIRDGAMPISSAQEILEALNLARLGAQLDFGRAAPPASDEERTLMGVLTREPQHIDEVARQTGLAAAMVSGTLALLELKGLVRDVGGLNFVRVREDDAPYSVEETEDGRAS